MTTLDPTAGLSLLWLLLGRHVGGKGTEEVREKQAKGASMPNEFLNPKP